MKRYVAVDYLKEFECVAGKCEDTCCAGWQIMIDKKSMTGYKKYKGDYKKTLKAGINPKKGCFKQDGEKRCSFLNEDNLCDMYINMGKDSLCKTCRLYPRHIEEFENVREISLSLSCPVVAKILLNRLEPVQFIAKEVPGNEEYEDFDLFLYSVLLYARETMIDIMQNRSMVIGERILLCIGLSHDIDIRVKRNDIFSCNELIEKYRSGYYNLKAAKKYSRYSENLKANYEYAIDSFAIFNDMETLRDGWKNSLLEACSILLIKGEEEYHNLMKEFGAWMKKRESVSGDIILEQLMVYYIFTYFCGSVYDEKIYGTMKMSLRSVTMIWHMMAAAWYRNEGNLDMDEICDIAYRLSRELEHSDKNLDMLLDTD